MTAAPRNAIATSALTDKKRATRMYGNASFGRQSSLRFSASWLEEWSSNNTGVCVGRYELVSTIRRTTTSPMRLHLIMKSRTRLSYSNIGFDTSNGELKIIHVLHDFRQSEG